MNNPIDYSNDTKLIKILWTGGWDSSYRVVELSRKKVSIQPIYIYGDGRPSERYEIKAMHKIMLALKNKKNTLADILPIRFINKNSIPLNQEITEAYSIISKKTNLGSQHEWLARLAYYEPGMEIGTEAAPLDISNILRAITTYGTLIKEKDGDCYILDPMKSNNDLRSSPILSVKSSAWLKRHCHPSFDLDHP